MFDAFFGDHKMKIKSILATVALVAIAIPVFASIESGLKVGDRVTPFHPDHVSGPLAGSSNCFPCTFQNRPAVQVWVHGDDMKNIQAIAKELKENMDGHKGKEFKAMIVMIADNAKQMGEMKSMIAQHHGTKVDADGVAIAVIEKNNEALKAYKINLDSSVKNTVIIYKNWKVEKTFVNLKMDENGCGEFCKSVAAVTN